MSLCRRVTAAQEAHVFVQACGRCTGGACLCVGVWPLHITTRSTCLCVGACMCSRVCVCRQRTARAVSLVSAATTAPLFFISLVEGPSQYLLCSYHGLWSHLLLPCMMQAIYYGATLFRLGNELVLVPVVEKGGCVVEMVCIITLEYRTCFLIVASCTHVPPIRR